MSIAKTPIRPTPISDNDSTLEKAPVFIIMIHYYHATMSVDRNEPKYGSF